MTHQELLKKATTEYDTALHLLRVTYPLLKDPKLLIRIINNLFDSLETGMEAILAYDKDQIPTHGNTFMSKLNVFYSNSVQTHKIEPQFTNLMQKLNSIIEQHKKSPIEFKRDDQFVICNKNYGMEQLSLKDVQKYLDQSRAFLEVVNNLFK